MLKLSNKLSRLFFQEAGDKIGIQAEERKCIDKDCEFIIVYKQDGDYLAHISELKG